MDIEIDANVFRYSSSIGARHKKRSVLAPAGRLVETDSDAV